MCDLNMHCFDAKVRAQASNPRTERAPFWNLSWASSACPGWPALHVEGHHWRRMLGPSRMIPRLNSLHNGRAQGHQDWRRRGRAAAWPRTSSLCFSTFEGLCTLNFPLKASPWTLSSAALFFTVWGKTFGENELKYGTWLLHDDNAPSYRALVTLAFLAHNSIITLPHPLYTPDLAPCEFFLFPKMKLQLKGCHFVRVEEIQRESQNVLGTLREQDFQHLFQQ